MPRKKSVKKNWVEKKIGPKKNRSKKKLDRTFFGPIFLKSELAENYPFETALSRIDSGDQELQFPENPAKNGAF